MHRSSTLESWACVVSVAVLSLLLPHAAEAHGRGRSTACLAPNGVDDTEALQAALNECSGGKGRCRVRLCEGVFRVRQVRVSQFNGTLEGAGRDGTVIRALPDLEVNDNPEGYVFDDPFDPQLAPWPFLLQFFEGRGTIEDLTVEVPAPEDPEMRPTQGWLGDTIHELAGAILISGREPVDYTVDQVRVLGASDPTSALDTTLLSGIYFQGTLFNPDDPGLYPVFPVQGRLRITRSEFESMLSGTPLAELDHAKVSLVRNDYRSMLALDILDSSCSRVRIANNTFETEFRSILIFLNVDGEPSQRNTFLIFSNRGSVGVGGDGFFFQDPFFDDRAPGDSHVALAYNRFELGDATGPAASGMSILGAGSLLVGSNHFEGQANVGIRADDTTGCWLFFNSFSGLDTRDGPDLELGPGTSECLALVSRHDDVEDDGTNNRILRR